MAKSEKEEDQKMKMLQCTQSNNRNARTKVHVVLPDDVIIEILSRTPGSSLVTFRRVCKLWRSLTYDHRLINLHLERTSNMNPPRVMIFSRDDQKYHLSILDEAWCPRYRLTRASTDCVLATPPCNGLICLYDSCRNIKLCNPTTQEFLTLPKPTSDCRIITNPFPRCSFGFHPSTKKYKVVRFFYIQLNHRATTYVLGCEVYTLGSSDSWRHIGNVYSHVTGRGINVDGSMYWTAGLSQIPDEIIVLDLESEKFRAIAPPDVSGLVIVIDMSMFLVQLEGSLCIVNASYGPTGAMDIWMLKDTDTVWIRRCHVTLDWNHRIWFCTVEPVFIYDGKILIRSGGYLYYCDLEGKQPSVKKVYHVEHLGDSAKFYAFVESLVPLRI